jgi:hypothetical protein
MRDFATSAHCRMRSHCRACRTALAWRAAAGAPDICPYGVTIDGLPAVVDLAATLVARLAACKECDDDSCSITHQTDCRRRAILGRESFHCSEGRF